MDEAQRVSDGPKPWQLPEAKLEEMRRTYGKIGIVDYNDHQIVFRRPTRDNCREYRRRMASDMEKGDATEFLAQASIIAFDGETDANRARTVYTGVFLEEYPLFAFTGKVRAVLAALTGMVEEEDAVDLGKGAQVRSGPPKSTPAA